MNVNLIVADDFLPNPEQVREAALKSDFGPRVHDGVTYQGVGVSNQPDFSPLLANLLGSNVAIRMSFFRCMVEGEEPTSYIHADNACAAFAGVLYLNKPEQCRGGTAFWRHKQTDWTSWYPGYGPEVAKKIQADGQDESLWVQESLIGMRFNRFITYPTTQFHSMYPKAPWAKDRENARLIWACFYDIIP